MNRWTIISQLKQSNNHKYGLNKIAATQPDQAIAQRLCSIRISSEGNLSQMIIWRIYNHFFKQSVRFEILCGHPV